MSLKGTLIFLMVIVISVCSHSQDIHFSQFWNAPLNLNPAETGDFTGDYRFVLNNKNQWMSFTNAYATFAGSADAGFEELLMKNSKSGVGFLLNNDIAGDGRLTTTQFMLSFSHLMEIGAEKKLTLGFGTGASYTLSSIQWSEFRFGSQYTIDQYDPFADSQETWQFDRTSYFGINAGVSAKYIIDTGFNLSFGTAAYHINQPGRSFIENSEAHLPTKWTHYIKGEYNIKDDLWIEPYFLFMHQQKYREILVGGLFRFDYNPLTFRSIFIGGMMRTRDAGIFVLGADYQNVKLAINYDINLSTLSTVSRGRGGVEFSLIYIIMKPRPFEAPHYRKCPDFI